MPPVEYYRALAREKILELVERELALIVPAEVAAKLSDRPVLTLPPRVRGIDVHHLQPAWNELVRNGRLQRIDEHTRGGRRISVITPGDHTGRTRAISDAAARKRLLHARYLSWASGSPSTPGIIGPAGERIVHQALSAAAPTGYRLVNPAGSGQTTALFGQPVPVGPLDNAAHLLTLDADGMPAGTITVLIEVKNVRQTLYPGDDEVHQLLDKAAQLQLRHPNHAFLPVLVCRSAHHTTINLANTIGAYVINTKQQFISTYVDPTKLAPVVTELGYDLVALDAPEPALPRHFTQTLQADAVRRAAAWAHYGPALADLFPLLRQQDLNRAARDELRSELLERADLRDHLPRPTEDGDLDDPPW